MKILELRLKNLNSLYGEWRIDFTDAEYNANGIFALIGPTGAGKSSILDAICLALYGATPRLGRITKSANEIMSRQTGECYAEVVFESQSGRYRCHWEQRKARKSPEGKLQDQEHNIADADTGKLIETKKSLVLGVIEEKTGMDFDRFTRSILLAQGDFDTFLKADAEQKSKILEQITGTEIYSSISRNVHERQREESNKLKLLEAETSGIAFLSAEEESQIKERIEQQNKIQEEYSEKHQFLTAAQAWLLGVKELENTLFSLVEEETLLNKELTLFEPERDRLTLAEQAADLDAEFANLSALRRELKKDQQSLTELSRSLPELENRAGQQSEALDLCESNTLKAKETLKQAAPLIQEVRLLDQHIAFIARSKNALESQCEADRDIIKKDNLSLNAILEKIKKSETALVNLQQYLQLNKHDSWLVGGYTGIETQLDNASAVYQQLTETENKLQVSSGELAELSTKIASSEIDIADKIHNLKAIENKIELEKNKLNQLLKDRSLNEYRREKDALLREMALIRRIEELENLRSRLEDGKECPLCGSREHPFAAGNTPLSDPVEQKITAIEILLANAEDIECDVINLENNLINIKNTLLDTEKKRETLLANRAFLENKNKELFEYLSSIKEQFSDLQKTIETSLGQLGISSLNINQIGSLLSELKDRLERWQRKESEKSEIDAEITQLKSELERLKAIIQTNASALELKKQKAIELEKELALHNDKRIELYGNKKPAEEEAKLNTAIDRSEASEKVARQSNIELQNSLNSLLTQVELLKKRVVQRKPELESSESTFKLSLSNKNFDSEQNFLEARLSTEQQAFIINKAKSLDNRATQLKTRKQDREKRLAEEKRKQLTDRSLEQLTSELESTEAQLSALNEEITALKHKIKQSIEAKEQLKDKQAEIDAQKLELEKWLKLHSLIGSADGKKFRNFAQGLTFELMMNHANHQLEKMTDRYLLIRDEEQALELNVIDNYQAGEIRSTKNLSGGESFIVSLALALGLSSMSSRKVRVDSLFLDEGFGTLDEEALDTALEVLSGLQQEGKLIGVISHISALKERITCQIQIAPNYGGRSTIKGPGCKFVS